MTGITSSDFRAMLESHWQRASTTSMTEPETWTDGRTVVIRLPISVEMYGAYKHAAEMWHYDSPEALMIRELERAINIEDIGGEIDDGD